MTDHSNATAADRDRLLKLLLHESAEARDDDRYMFAQYAAVISAAVLVIAAMATAFYLTCPEGPGCVATEKITPVSVWIYVGAPMLPIVLVAYGIFISAIQTLRSYYLRTIELKIHQLTGQCGDKLPIPSWAHAQLEVTGQAHAGKAAWLNLLLMFAIICLMVIECLYLALCKIPGTRLQIFALAVDGTLIAILVSVAILNVTRGAHSWEQALKSLPERLRRTEFNFPPPDPPKERSLPSFLLLPRNQEELLKALFIPICFGIGRWLAPGIPRLTSDLLWHFVGFFFVFEFIMYQGRYLLNDIRDRKDDCKEGLQKKRFPCSWIADEQTEETALRAAFASFAARWVIAALIIGCLLPFENWKWSWHVAFVLGIFVIAFLYETARSKCKATAEDRVKRQIWTVVVIAFVGFGYGLRAVVGLWLAGVDDKMALILLAIGASLFGSMFVALTWALESTRGREENLRAGKAHLLLFGRAVSRRSEVPVGPTEKILAGRQSLLAPWSILAVLATASLAAFALYLVRGHLGAVVFSIHLGSVRTNVSQLALVAWAVAGIALVAVATRVSAAFVLTALTLLGVGVVLHHLSVPMIPSAIAAMIVALPLIVTCSFRNMRFNDLPGFTDKLIKAGAVGISSLYSWFKRAR